LIEDGGRGEKSNKMKKKYTIKKEKRTKSCFFTHYYLVDLHVIQQYANSMARGLLLLFYSLD
jgi:hypothetical protein